jgi:hypothetical protein
MTALMRHGSATKLQLAVGGRAVQEPVRSLCHNIIRSAGPLQPNDSAPDARQVKNLI